MFSSISFENNHLFADSNISKINARQVYKLAIQHETRVKNLTKAIVCYQQAADFGLSDAMLALGRIYSDSSSNYYNHQKASYWYQQAVDNRNQFAEFELEKFNVESSLTISTQKNVFEI